MVKGGPGRDGIILKNIRGDLKVKILRLDRVEAILVELEGNIPRNISLYPPLLTLSSPYSKAHMRTRPRVTLHNTSACSEDIMSLRRADP